MNICKSFCVLHYERAPHAGGYKGFPGGHGSPYEILHVRYCRNCEFSYHEKDWMTFNNPRTCVCCHGQLRLRRKTWRKRQEKFRYD